MKKHSNVHIAIVGAGPAGLLLAYVLHRASIPFTVFESRSQAAHIAQQGGSLDLHAKTGCFALDAAGLLPTLLAHTRYTGNGVNLTDKNLRTWFAWSGGKSKPNIDRADLIQALISLLPPQSIIWSAQVLSASATHLNFAASDFPAPGPFSLIVGCDGTWSRIRPTLSQQSALYSGVTGQTFTIPNASHSNSNIVRGVAEGAGAHFSFGDHQAMILHRLSRNRATVTLFQAQLSTTPMRALEKPRKTAATTGITGNAAVDPVALAAAVRTAHYTDWDPQLRAVLEAVDDETSVSTWVLHALPVGFRWTHVRGITCIGDAAHVMPPFGGEGVNGALLDAHLLGEAIVRSTASAGAVLGLDEEVREFEEVMWTRADRAQTLSQTLMQCMMFEKGSPRSGVEKYLMARACYETKPSVWPIMRLFYGACVHGTYAVLKAFRSR